MRVLYFSRDYTPHDYRFLNSLAESGREVYFLRLERSGRQVEDRPLPPSVQQIQWQGGRGPFRWQDLPGLLVGLRRVLADVRPDILHAGPIQTAGFLSALSGFRPLVSMSWGSDLLKDANRSRAYQWITRYTLNQSTVLVGDCQAVRDKAVSFGYPRQKTFMFPWGIDLDRFSPKKAAGETDADSLRVRLGWQNNFVVLSLRSWEPVYGIDVMLRGFARAAKEEPSLRLLMLGGGSLAGMVHQIIQENGLRNQVYLGGQVTQANLPEIYRAADLYLSASHSDGSSVSLMEALGCGLPVLVTGIPSNREWVTEEAQGWLFADNDEAAVAARILQACAQPEKLAQMAKSARARAEERADWKKNFRILEQAYEEALQL